MAAAQGKSLLSKCLSSHVSAQAVLSSDGISTLWEVCVGGGGGAAHRRNDTDDWFHLWLQEEHHCAAFVPLLRAATGEHLHSGAEYPRHQPRQPEEVSGGHTSGLRHPHDDIFINTTLSFFIYSPKMKWLNMPS